MMRTVLILSMLLSACVQTPPKAEKVVSGELSRMPSENDGTSVMAGQRSDWPQMISTVDATGKAQVVQSGTAPTVIVSGAPDFATAVKVLGQFCGRKIDPAGFDTQFVYREPWSGNYWFDGFCG